ncbi:hypothetical protein DSM112329_03925 [Paraconexibacter sp. AEG42_29]|uniref:DUF3618 domain-containing protein n=1 Tax=Paraconexibacter sp. AEG42_29 TaxID=2997339 RepID=A0AAU7AZ96_9ACTN
MADRARNEPESIDLEAMLRRALKPVDPPEDLAARLDETLTSLTDLVAEELEAWELAAIGDPRRWVDGLARPAVAAAVGGAAGAALVALRVHQGRGRRKARANDPLDYAEQTVRAVADEARKLLDR